MLVLLAQHGRLTAGAVGFAVVAGVLASVVPDAADLTALRYVPARLSGVFMSVHPVLAALVGMGLLDQFLRLHEWIGVAVVVLANAVAVGTSSGRGTPTVSADEDVPTPVAGPGLPPPRRPAAQVPQNVR